MTATLYCQRSYWICRNLIWIDFSLIKPKKILILPKFSLTLKHDFRFKIQCFLTWLLWKFLYWTAYLDLRVSTFSENSSYLDIPRWLNKFKYPIFYGSLLLGSDLKCYSGGSAARCSGLLAAGHRGVGSGAGAAVPWCGGSSAPLLSDGSWRRACWRWSHWSCVEVRYWENISQRV